MEVSRLNRNWMRVILRECVMFVVVWCWDQGDIFLRVCLISTENGAVAILVLVHLLDLSEGSLGSNGKVVKLYDVLMVDFGIVGIVGSSLRIMVVCLGIQPA